MAYVAYNLLLGLLSPLAVPLVIARSILRGQPWHRTPERLGRVPRLLRQTGAGGIWLHAVSVGEVLTAVALVRKLRERFPNAPIVVSTTTPTGFQMAQDKLSGLVEGVFYSPLDLPWMVRRVFSSLQPRLLVVMETEVWPNLFRQAKLAGASLMIVNGRISDRAAPRYRRFRLLFAGVLKNVDRIQTQSSLDRERWIAAGAEPHKVTVCGNLKYDFEPGSGELPLQSGAFLARVAPSPLIVAGSTREEEEKPVVEAFLQVAQKRPQALLVLAPRHPQRFDEVAGLLKAAGVPFVRRSELAKDGEAGLELPRVLLLDTLGELSAFYRPADAVFVGGSLNGWGGHNVLEAAVWGRPVVVGPYMQNFREIAGELLAKRALVQIAGRGELPEALEKLLAEPGEAAAMGARAREVAKERRGASQRAADQAERLYEAALPAARPGFFRKLALGPLSFLWRAATSAHRGAYESGRRDRRRLRAFTVSVGNLSAGGTGKTPATAWLAQALSEHGYKPAVLTRGYGRSSREPVILRPGAAVGPDATGDEAQILLRRFERNGFEIPIGVDANRLDMGRRMEEAQRLDVFLLDDGFQHHRLARDFDLVLIDVTKPLEDYLLPLGRLREPLAALGRASAFLLTRAEPGRRYPALEERLRQINPSAPVFRSRFAYRTVVDAASGGEIPVEQAAEMKWLGFCGLGNPASFWRSLAEAGIRPAERVEFPDHHRYSQTDRKRLKRSARNVQADALITTEKDLVNLGYAARAGARGAESVAADLFSEVPFYWLQGELLVEGGGRLVSHLAEQIAFGSGEDRERGPARHPERVA